MRVIKNLRIVEIFVVLSFLTGCAAFREDQLQPITSWPLETSYKNKSISLIISGKAIVNGEELEVNKSILSIWRKQTVSAYRESGLFSEVKTGLVDSDLRAEIKILDQGEGSLGLAFLSGFTFTLIPAKAYDEFFVTTTLIDNEGRELGRIVKSETINSWIQLFLIFVMPFNWPNSVAKEVLYDLNRATINEAHKIGVFNEIK